MVSEQNSVYKKKAGPLLALPECRGLVMPGGGIEPPTQGFYIMEPS